MFNKKQFGCLKILSVNFIKNWKIKQQKSFLFAKRNFPPDKGHPGHRSRYGKYVARFVRPRNTMFVRFETLPLKEAQDNTTKATRFAQQY